MSPEDIKTLIDQLLATGELIATEAFRVALQQVVVLAIQEALGVVAILFTAVALYRLGKYLNDTVIPADEEDNWNGVQHVVYGISLTLAVIGIVLIGNVAGYFINPEWYAIKMLLELL